MATEEKLPGALKVPGGITDGYKIIHRRREDNLPDHVKGSVLFHTFKDENDRYKPITGYYTNDNQKRVAVELLKDEEHEDAWYILDQDTSGRVMIQPPFFIFHPLLKALSLPLRHPHQPFSQHVHSKHQFDASPLLVSLCRLHHHLWIYARPAHLAPPSLTS